MANAMADRAFEGGIDGLLCRHRGRLRQQWGRGGSARRPYAAGGSNMSA
jgi:hypothetical protein